MTTAMRPLLLFLSLTVSEVGCAGDLPSRSACITEVRLDGVPRLTEGLDVDELFAVARRGEIPLAAYRIRGNSIFFQFKYDCNERKTFSSSLMRKVLRNPQEEFVISESIVEPGADTIDVAGKFWKDGQRDNIEWD